VLRGIYASACGLVAQAARQELLAANLAHASTVGYKRSQAACTAFPEGVSAAPDACGWLNLGVTVTPAILDLTEGPLEKTDNPLDLALVGEGFFVVAGPRSRLYTRAGRFRLDAASRLVTPDGYPVLGQRGPLVLPPGEVVVAKTGLVSVNGRPVDTLRIVRFVSPAQLVPVGGGYLAARGPEQPAAGVEVLQGSVEHSNVRPAAELSRMLLALRIYEANVMAMRTQDQALGRLLNAVS
jgi:flagellar basal-body rod protein FlgF